MKRLFTFALFLPLTAGAQTCVTSTCTAASTSESDVLAALPASGNTNATVTVNVPSGSTAWTTGFSYTIPSAVTSLIIQGNTTVSCSGTGGTSGYSCTPTDNTVFIDSYNAANGPLMSINVGTKSFRMTGITFQGGTISAGNTKPNGFLNFSGTSSSFRVDHSHFNTNTYSIGNAGGGMTIFTNLYGVIDHSVFDMASQNNGIRDYAGYADFGDTNWSQPTNFGTSGFLYAENDVFNAGAANDCDAGGKMVIRYSNIYAAPGVSDTGLWQGHSMGQGQQRSRGCRALEIYNNYVLNSGAAIYADGDGGSGTGLVWGNHVSGYNNDIIFLVYRELATGHSQTDPPNGIGYCGNGSDGVASAWDGNSSLVTGYPCINQTGRGQGDLLNGQNFPGALNTVTGTISWPRNLREPWYVWNETVVGGTVCSNPSYNGVAPQPNQAFFCPNGSFSGATGTGFGVASSRPSNCTPGPGGPYDTSPGGGSYGVAYYATDTNTLSVCTKTNTWTAVYQPYTYPHPLIGGTTTYALSTATAGTGSGSVSGCAGSYTSGQAYSCSVTPSGGSTLTSVTGCGGSGTTTYAGTMPASNCTVTATFSGTPQTATPVISPSGATYPRSQTVTIADSTPSSTIYYTTNGTTPTTGSTVYSGSFSATSSTNVQAIATASGYTQSAVGQSTISITSAIVVDGGQTAQCALTNAVSCGALTAFAGDTILVDASDGLGTLTAPTDGTNTYHLLNKVTDSTNPFTAYQWVACNVGAGTYMTSLNGIGSGNPVNLHVKILANTSTSTTCWDAVMTQGQANTTGSTTPTSGSAQTPTGNNEWVEGYIVPNTTGSQIITAGTNYTILGLLTTYQPAAPEFWNQGTATATNSPVTLSISQDWVDVMTAILPAGGSTPVCGQPIQLGPNYSGTYNSPPYTLPLTIGFTEATPGCTMHYTATAGTTTTAATCGSPTYSGSSTVSSTITYSVIACQSGYTSSSLVGGTWTIVTFGPPPQPSIILISQIPVTSGSTGAQ